MSDGASARRWKFLAAAFTKTSAADVSEAWACHPWPLCRARSAVEPTVIVPGAVRGHAVTVVGDRRGAGRRAVVWTASMTMLPLVRTVGLVAEVACGDAASRRR